MTRVLLRAGHTVHWVTLDPTQLPHRDAALGSMTPAEVVVHGSGGVNLVDRPARHLAEKVLRSFIFSLPSWSTVLDRHVEWSRRLRRELPAIVRREQIDVVLLCCGPHGQLDSVPALRRLVPRTRILVDYRDLLSGNTWRERGSSWVRRRVKARERRLLEQADALFVNTRNARDSFLATFPDLDLPVEVMRNTADYELGDAIRGLGPPIDLGPGAHLGFFGTIFPKRRLAPLLDAMEQLEPAVLSRITAHVWCDAFGSRQLLEQDLAKRSEAVRARVQRHDLLEYGEALRTMAACDALVLVNSPEQGDQIFVPGKAYDYLMARRPILFFGRPGDAWDIVVETTGAAWCFEHHEAERSAGLLARIAADRPADIPPAPRHLPEASFAPLIARLGDGATRRSPQRA